MFQELLTNFESASERSIGICFIVFKKTKQTKKKEQLVEEFPFGTLADGHTAKCIQA